MVRTGLPTDLYPESDFRIPRPGPIDTFLNLMRLLFSTAMRGGHRWIPETENPPNCPSKEVSFNPLWNKGGVDGRTREAESRRVVATKRRQGSTDDAINVLIDRAMDGYYTERRAVEGLRACYDLAPPRTKAYLEAEIEFVLAKTTPSMLALELGCGYGRVLERLLPRVRGTFGIHTSPSSLCMALEYLGRKPSLCLACMDAVQMGFRDRIFDLTICIQNGICAFAVDQQQLFREAIRVNRSGGLVIFSSYTPQFWEHRLEWLKSSPHIT